MNRTLGANAAHQVRAYLDAHPFVRDALAGGIVNLSALARQIEPDDDRHDAVLVALRRQRDDLQDEETPMVHTALAESRLEVRSGVGILSFEPSWKLLRDLSARLDALQKRGDRVHLLHGWEAITVVADESILDDLSQSLGRTEPLEYRHGVAELNVRAREKLADVPGFIAAITSGLANRGIRIIDAVTCRRDHVFLIEEEDLSSATDALRPLTTSGRNQGN